MPTIASGAFAGARRDVSPIAQVAGRSQRRDRRLCLSALQHVAQLRIRSTTQPAASSSSRGIGAQREARRPAGPRPAAAGPAAAGATHAPYSRFWATADHRAVRRRLQARALRPLVERPHRRAAPHLVVELPAGLAGVRPPARQPQIPAEHEGHLVPRVGLGPRQLRRVAALEERPASGPTPPRTWRGRASSPPGRARPPGSPPSSDTARYSSYSLSARMGNMVPRLSTCTFTPISNMSAAGAIVTSACPASASIFRTGVRAARLDARLVDADPVTT